MEEGTWSSWMRLSEVSLILDWDKARKYSLHSDSLRRSTLKEEFTQKKRWAGDAGAGGWLSRVLAFPLWEHSLSVFDGKYSYQPVTDNSGTAGRITHRLLRRHTCSTQTVWGRTSKESFTYVECMRCGLDCNSGLCCISMVIVTEGLIGFPLL